MSSTLSPQTMVPIEGEPRRRVVSVKISLSQYFCQHWFPCAQCYFFDSDIGGFHYGPGHPLVVSIVCINFQYLSYDVLLQNEAYTDTNVPRSGDELWAIQEDGNLCAYFARHLPATRPLMPTLLQRAKPATKREMSQFHSDEYVDFLNRINPTNMNSYIREQLKCMSALLTRLRSFNWPDCRVR
jgi:hypothetical protein